MEQHSSILVTGGTGSFGNRFVPMVLSRYDPARLVIYSRDEMKQWEMAKSYTDDSRGAIFSRVTLEIRNGYTGRWMASITLFMQQRSKLFP